MTTTPTVSVGMPVYNGEAFVKSAIDAILAQTFGDLELVISDNASEDGTEEICREAARLDSRIRYLRADENRGAAWNYNNVFKASTGRFFRWAAHDDLCAPTHLERCVQALTEGDPSIVLAYPRATVVDENGVWQADYDEPFGLSDPEPHVRLGRLTRHLVKGNMLFGLMRSSALARTRLHGAYATGDWVLIAELALQGPFLEVPERLFVRRRHPGMSRVANATLEDVAEFFAPGSGVKASGEFSRLFREFLVAIHRAPVGRAERARAYCTFVPLYVARHKRALGREARRALARGGNGSPRHHDPMGAR
jgi:glycosyltransferase involved in cell wall biosynthesis